MPSVAELLVWAETACMADYSGFQSALTALRECKGSAEAEAIEQLDSHVQRVQMVVRKRGQQLNGRAREQGFMLCGAFLRDPSSAGPTISSMGGRIAIPSAGGRSDRSDPRC